jgi:hypothetical protein
MTRVRKNRTKTYLKNNGGVAGSGTQVFVRCMHPKLEKVLEKIWDLPEQDSKINRRSTSVGELLLKSKWEKPLTATAGGQDIMSPDDDTEWVE